ncbi:MAG: 8-amino-7-oxononanoate synthase [Anaerolineae bacterium]|nr:8-amino-7-oxononanoate synthase [Gloeobacterales cyanobacterium ES-bin-313]
MADPYEWLADDLKTLHRAGWYRSTRVSDGLAGPTMIVEGKAVVQFASNNYLGLCGDPRLGSAAQNAIARWGTGATGSRLLSGERPVHRDLEKALAGWKGTEDCLLFSSGYLANLGTIQALVGPKDLVLSDEYNHSSLRSGAELSGATQHFFAHNDMEALANLLEKERNRYRRCLVCVDSIFSMDGDLAPLPEIMKLAEQYECMVVVDEAHGTGVLGASGAGSLEHFNLKVPIIEIGTLSKALGSLGGYVCGNSTLIDYLRNRARTWIYTTGLSPGDAAAALEGVRLAQSELGRRSQLWENIAQLSEGLQHIGIAVFPSDSAILCGQVGNIAATCAFSEKLFEQGFYAPAIRPPTVPTSRIRFSVMATHTQEMISKLLLACQQIC